MILDQIVHHKRRAELPRLPPVDRALLRDLTPCKSFQAGLVRPAGAPIRVIAETKKGSPSKGIFRSDYDPVLNAYRYLLGGASAISVLTDERFFFGSGDHLAAVRQAVDLPLLWKDFLVDVRQISRARILGADAVLLIAACLEDGEIRDLAGFAQEWGLAVLLEVHDATEAGRAVALQAPLVGINNRDLRTFKVDLRTTFDLLTGLRAPGRVVVSESGIASREDCQRLEAAGADAVLVGETLMLATDPARTLKDLRGLA